jgi:hypothetical protein
MNEEAASRTPGMRFSFLGVEKVAGTENTKTTAGPIGSSGKPPDYRFKHRFQELGTQKVEK